MPDGLTQTFEVRIHQPDEESPIEPMDVEEALRGEMVFPAADRIDVDDRTPRAVYEAHAERQDAALERSR